MAEHPDTEKDVMAMSDRDKRFRELRAGGWTGPIDQDGSRVEDLDRCVACLTLTAVVCTVLHMTSDVTRFQHRDIAVTITRTGEDVYTREVTIAGDLAYLVPDHRTAYPGRPDGHVDAALSAITSLRAMLDSEIRSRRTNLGTYGELQDRFADRLDDLWAMWCEIQDAPLSEVREAAEAYAKAGEAGRVALGRRDDAIRRAARSQRIPRTRIAEAAGISRERLYQITGVGDE